jgi:hypothetical protein
MNCFSGFFSSLPGVQCDRKVHDLRRKNIELLTISGLTLGKGTAEVLQETSFSSLIFMLIRWFVAEAAWLDEDFYISDWLG